MKFSHIKYRGGKNRRVYTADSKIEAQSFAFLFSGYYYQFTEGNFYVII